MFFGNTLTNARSTYQSLRTTGGSTCGGGQINRSAYWFPAVLKDNVAADGGVAAIKSDFAIVYYSVDDVRRLRLTRVMRGMTYVFGFNPNDPTDSAIKAEIAAANLIGNQQAYRYLTNGFLGWKCEQANGSNPNSPVPGSNLQPYLRNADGTATLTCPNTERIGAVAVGPTCWDGRNLTSPNGRGHVRHVIGDQNTGQRAICPQGWYEIPLFELVVWFSHTGPSDYKEWYLSSDRMPGHTQFLNGQSFHTDWFGAWDYPVMTTWMRNCNGIAMNSVPGNPHSCIDTEFGDGTAGIVGSPAPDGSRNPQLDFTTRWANQGPNRYLPVP